MVSAAATAVRLAWLLGSYRESGWALTNIGTALVAMLVIGVAVTIVYVLLMAVFRVPELRDARGLLRRRTPE